MLPGAGPPPCRLIHTYHCGVICEHDDGVGAMYRDAVKGEEGSQPCGTPVLRVRVEEVMFFNLTLWGLLVRRSSVQLQREVPRSRDCEMRK